MTTTLWFFSIPAYNFSVLFTSPFSPVAVLDVITKGETMLYYRDRLLKSGAIVVGGLCLGKTKHEKPITLLPQIVEYDEDTITGA